jgi:FtsH-binding integral membrane protein
MKEHPGTFLAGVVFVILGLAGLFEGLEMWNLHAWRLWPIFVIALGLLILLSGRRPTSSGGG